ncbi:hypothetical protein UFOVP190_196 [uncultured Caudovirales phage]|uniref:Uncharacterized protein n=1 Tax=uncultured Caudovirales phage TaxID=2100421 RepID=A0A6J7WHG7_9CAUD|nr:hypothetical protein UFOVP190_196 [uncultured Caudovirales phage]
MEYKHEHIETFIEIIAGYRNPAGIIVGNLYMLSDPLISLARYDVKVIENLCQQSQNKIAYTDRQAKLAVDLIVKYERQLAKHNISIENVKVNPEFRMPLRTIDRSTRVWVEDNIIKIRFPYAPNLIESIREQSKTNRGTVKWNPDKKIWEADLTEYTVNWAYAFAQAHNFEIDSSLKEFMDLILAVEATPYTIELKADDDRLSITNAATTLSDYIDEKLGGFGLDNLLTLVDYAPILGYTCDPVIQEVVIDAYGTRFWSLCHNRELKVDQRSYYTDQLAEIVRYAEVTNRFPIYVYEPDMSDKLTMLLIRHFTREQVVNLNNNETVTPETRLVYANKIPKTSIDRIPLMISSAGMLFGGDRALWIQQAEKVVYFTKEVYNKGVKGRDVCKLD